MIEHIMITIYPEILLSIALFAAIILSTTKQKDLIWIISSLLMLTGIFHLLKNFSFEPNLIFNGMFVVDGLSNIFRLLTLITALLILLGSVKYTEGFVNKSEFLIIFLSAVIGIMFLIGANDLITLFVSLETLGLSSIMLAGYSKYDPRSNEAALKYLLNTASASAIFLFGLSLIYGLTGSTQFDEIQAKLLDLVQVGGLNQNILIITLILLIGGLAFKLACAPFHMWSPDVYEGAPTPVTAFLSTASKAAGFVITLRLLVDVFGFAIETWKPILVIIAVLSMIVGNFIALGEVLNKTSVKRFMAYSSIAQVGYILSGIALGTNETISASVFYLIIYTIMNLGAFLCIIAFGNEANSDMISDYSGLAKKKPLLAFGFAVCLFNLSGLPIPPAGFIAKFVLFKSIFEAGTVGIILAVIGLVTTVLSVFYYSYVAKIMIVDEPSNAVLNIDSNVNALGKSKKLNLAIISAVAAVFILSVISNPILKASNIASNQFTKTSTLVSLKK